MKKLLALLAGVLMTASLITGCSSKEPNNKTDVSIDLILESIEKVYGEDYLPNMALPEESLEAEFGLTPDMYEEAKGFMPMMSTHPDRVVIVKAASGKAGEVENAFKTARDRKINDELQYPMNIPKVDATQVIREGDYVAFLLVGAPLENLDSTEAEAADYFQKQVDKAVTAFKAHFK